MIDATFIDEFKKDFNPSKLVFRDNFKDWNYDWENFYRENIKKLDIRSIFINLIHLNKDIVELFFNSNFLQKYRHIEYEYQTYKIDCYKYTFSLPELLWSLSLKQEIKLTNEQFIQLIPLVENLEKKFINNIIIDDNEIINEKILEYLDYKLGVNQLKILYCRNNKEILSKLKLEVNNKLLQYALVYGSIDVLNLLDERGLLEKHDNPFILDCVDYIYSVDDIWDGWSWGNDEYDREIICQENRSLEKCFEICKKYFEVKEEWFKIWVDKSDNNNGYGPNISIIISLFIDEEKLKTKEGIIELKDKFGENYVWDVLSKKGSYILDILLK